MTNRSNARHYMGIALSVGLAATAGCAAPAATTAPDETQLRQSIGQGPSAAAQAASDLGLTKQPIQTEEFKLIAGDKPLTKALVVVGDQFLVPDERGVIRLPKSAALADGKSVISVMADGYVPVTMPVVGGAALQLTPIDSARTAISATNGGIARNADGTMEVSFAPGSLSKDAKVAVTRVYNEQFNTYYMPAAAPDTKRTSLGEYTYHLELDGAEVTSAANIIVKFKVEGKLKENFDQLLAEPKGLEGSNIKDDFSKDTQGTMWFAMKNPAALPKPEELLRSTFSLLAQSCPSYPNDHWFRTDRIIKDNYIDNGCNNRGDGGVAFHDSQWNGGHCMYISDSSWQCEGGGLVQYVQTRIDAPSSGVVAKVTWQSNDGRISGPVSNALVSFNHAGTVVRAATSQAYTDGDGEAAGVGAQGANGTASPKLQSQPWTIGTPGGYTVNCGGPVQLKIIKNKPIVKFNFAKNGTPTSPGYALRTSHGNVSVGNLNGPTAGITMNSVSSASETFSVNGTWQPSGDIWIDAKSNGSTAIQWNNYNNGGNPNALATNIWFSKQIGANLTYLSNDDQASGTPSDQRPLQTWNTKAALANVAFSHPVSSFGGKSPASRDNLSFTAAAGSAGTWGLNGASGSVTATVNGPDTPTPVSLTGTTSYTVSGGSVGVRINANLPEMTITIREMETDDTTFKLVYTLDGSSEDKEMRLSRSGNTIRFSIPVEDELNKPKKHTFKIKWFGTENGNTTFWMANRAAFPSMTVARAGRYDHPALDGTLNAAK